MEITDFLTPDRVVLEVRARDKTALIGEDCPALRAVWFRALKPETGGTALLAREQLGSTGWVAGFALPHARIEGWAPMLDCSSRLAKPIDFDAIDGKPVRLVFVLLIPSESHDTPRGGAGGDLP